MKYILALVLTISFQAFANVEIDAETMREIRLETRYVLEDISDRGLNPRVWELRPVLKSGNNIKIEFFMEEDHYGKKICSYLFDITTSRSRANSILCRQVSDTRRRL